MPPETVIPWGAYGAFAIPAGREVVEMKIAGAAIVIEMAPEFEAPAASVARTGKENVPALAGVPESVPEAASDKPSGSAPETRDHV